MSAPRWIKVRADVPQFMNMRAFAKQHGIKLEIHDKASCHGVTRYRIGAGDARVTTHNPMTAWATLHTMAGVAS